MPITTTRLVAPVAVLAALPLLVWCQRPPEPAPSPAPATSSPTPKVVIDSTLNRAALLAALTEAGSALADGRDRDRDAGLNGRTVSVRLPFGCGGTAGADDAAAAGLPRLVRNPDGGLTLTVTPEDLKARISAGGVAPAAETSLDQWDAIEGFWIARPWSGADACPAPAIAATAPVAAPEASKVEADGSKPAKTAVEASPPVQILPERTAGLAAVVEADASRLGRRQGQAYAHVIRGEKGAAATPAPGGYALRLEGRLTTFADGKAVKCVQRDVESRPVCVAALRLDRLAFEDGATGALLSEWRPR